MSEPGELVVVDTNVVSYIFNRNPEVKRYLHYLYGKRMAVSFMTKEEILFGAKLKNWSERRIARLCELVDSFEIFHSSERIIECCAGIRAARKHKTIPVCDAWIAATALAADCPLVTHNPKDFMDIPGLEVVTFHVPKPR